MVLNIVGFILGLVGYLAWHRWYENRGGRRRTLDGTTGEEFFLYPDGRRQHIKWWM